ncbi:MAG: methionine aminotransferase [Ignavibacteriaceae bacterium]
MKNLFSVDSKLPEINTSIFAIMSRMANEHNAINLSQGFPDFNCSNELIDLVNHFMNKGFNQYAPMPGTLELRNEISKKITRDYGKFYNPDTEISITAGATQALFTAFSTIINPGDEVIIFEPAYDSYIPAIKLYGGVPVPISLNENDFTIPWSLVEQVITEKTKCIVINSPHNPTGTILSEEDITHLEDLVKDKNLFIISDEVYEHIVFDNQKHFSISSSLELSKRSFIISSFGKTFHTTGWKIGYCCAPEFLMREFRKIHQFVVFAVNTPIQLAVAEFMQTESNIYSLNKFYEDKRNLFRRLLKDSKFILRNCDGTYFQLLDYSQISGNDDFKFAEFLTKEIGVAVIPLSPFYSKKYFSKLIRVCFAKQDSILETAANKLNSI